MFSLLKRKAKTPRPGPARDAKAAKEKTLLPVGRDSVGPSSSVPRSALPVPRSNGQLLRARHVMSLLGVSKSELRKFIDCALLTPRYLPDPHRTGGRNKQKHQRAWFLASEVQSLTGHLKAKSLTADEHG